jgi:hypothetical protein
MGGDPDGRRAIYEADVMRRQRTLSEALRANQDREAGALFREQLPHRNLYQGPQAPKDSIDNAVPWWLVQRRS